MRVFDTLVFQLVFARRPGLSILMNLSVPAAVSASFRQLSLATPNVPRRKLFILALTVLAATGLIVDWLVSSYINNLRETREARIVWARAAVNASFPFPGIATGRLFPRDTVLDALASVFPTRFDQTNTWMRASGSFSEPDVLPRLLNRKLCSGDETFQYTGWLKSTRNFEFGFPFALPLPIGFAAETSGSLSRLPVGVGAASDLEPSADEANASQEPGQVDVREPPIYGVMAIGPFVQAYSTQCDLQPHEVVGWLNARINVPYPVFRAMNETSGAVIGNSTGSLFYADATEYRDLGTAGFTGYSLATFFHTTGELLARGTIELLSIGSESSGGKHSKRTSVIPASELYVSRRGPVYRTAAPLKGNINRVCTETAQSTGIIPVNTTAAIAFDTTGNWTRLPPFSNLTKAAGITASPQLCTIMFANGAGTEFDQEFAANNSGILVKYLSGAQVCRTMIKTFMTNFNPANFTNLANFTAADEFMDMIGAVQQVPKAWPVSLRCLDDTYVGRGSRPWLWTTALSGVRQSANQATGPGDGWAATTFTTARTGGWVRQIYSAPSYVIKDGAQMFIQTVVGVDVIELVITLAAVISVYVSSSVLGWSSMHKIAITAMYEFALRPRGPGEQPQAEVGDGIECVDLLQRTTLVLLELPTDPPARVIRLVAARKDGSPKDRLDDGAQVLAHSTSVLHLERIARDYDATKSRSGAHGSAAA
ncbi:hypothetical protein H9P43_008871 [Blastocladiella emersonii ATCC 22665]|nr:hypothetical protein H9P43_008871 [Blastocladiella emersonii ATCC 22665]